MASPASIPVPAVSNLSGMGSSPKRQTYVDVAKGATSRSAGSRPSSPRVGLEAKASSLGGVSGGSEVGKVPPNKPDEQVDAGEGGGGDGKVGSDPPGRTDERPEAGEGCGVLARWARFHPGRPMSRPRVLMRRGR